ncbi:MAG: hypothetical protein EA423_05790 [Phycisphaerales bacterium]|nr:MAG: hypothetical protein EA423_05790 [Phycisphaerales bacterium]
MAWAVTLGAAGLVALAWLWPFSFEDRSGPTDLVERGLIFIRSADWHLGLLTLALAALLAAFRFRLQAVTAALLVCWLLAPSLWHFVPRPTPEAEGPILRVGVANLHTRNPDWATLPGIMHDAEPDLLALQEHSGHWNREGPARLSGRWPHKGPSLRHRSNAPRYGVRLYHHTPFVEAPAPVPMGVGDDDGRVVRGVIEFGGRLVSVYSVHLPHDVLYTQQARIARPLMRELLRSIELDPNPIIIMGDFNTTPRGPRMAALRRAGLRNAWSMAGRGRGVTWRTDFPLRDFVGLRIDHVLMSEELVCTFIERTGDFGSDHLGLIAEIRWRGTD